MLWARVSVTSSGMMWAQLSVTGDGNSSLSPEQLHCVIGIVPPGLITLKSDSLVLLEFRQLPHALSNT